MATRMQIARAADLAIQTYKAKGIEELLAVEVSLRPLWRVNLTTGPSYACKLHIFGQPEELIHVTVQDGRLLLHRGQDMLTVDKLMQAVQHLPNPLDEPDVPIDMRQRRGWRLLENWWSINGKHFELLKLPAEIREVVYGQLLGYEMTAWPSRRSKRYAQALFSIDCSTRLAIARVCRQVHAELMKHISLYNEFGFRQGRTLRAALQTPWLATNMSRVSLQLSMTAYIDLFGMSFGHEGDIKPNPIAKAFRTLELRELSITMPDGEMGIPVWAVDFCLDCLTRFIVQAIWPFIYGHPCRVHSTVADLTAEQEGL